MFRSAERAGKQIVGSVLRTLFRAGGRPAPDTHAVESLLIVRQHNQLGDMLCTVPLLRTLRTAFPSARIALVTSPVNHAVMLHNRFVDDIILFDKGALMSPAGPRPGPLGAFLRATREGRPEWAIVPCTVSTSFTSDMIACLSWARVRLGCGRLDGRPSPSAFFLTHPVDLDWRPVPDRHQALRTMDIIRGIVPLTSELSSEITLTAGEKELGHLLSGRGDRSTPCIAFHPGAGKAPNRWAADRFARLAEILAAEFGARVFITCGPMDDAAVAAMEADMNIARTVIRGRPIREVASVLARMDLVVSNDTGIMHVAAAVGTPVLSLFGPTDPAQWAPVGPRHRFLRGTGGEVEAISLDQVLRESRGMLKVFGSRVLA